MIICVIEFKIEMVGTIFCFYYRVCFFPILYKMTRKFPILGVGTCSQNAEKKPCTCRKIFYFV